jgi:hypothetical protein
VPPRFRQGFANHAAAPCLQRRRTRNKSNAAPGDTDVAYIAGAGVRLGGSRIPPETREDRQTLRSPAIRRVAA